MGGGGGGTVGGPLPDVQLSNLGFGIQESFFGMWFPKPNPLKYGIRGPFVNWSESR